MDVAQLAALRTFKTDMQSKGLTGEYSNASQLEHEVWKAIEHDIVSLATETQDQLPTGPAVEFLVQPQVEREVTGVDNRGKPKYSTRRWLEVTNRGSDDAHGVHFSSVGDPTPMHLGRGDEVTVIHAGQMRRVGIVMTMGGGDSILRISWREGEGERSKDFYVD